MLCYRLRNSFDEDSAFLISYVITFYAIRSLYVVHFLPWSADYAIDAVRRPFHILHYAAAFRMKIIWIRFFMIWRRLHLCEDSAFLINSGTWLHWFYSKLREWRYVRQVGIIQCLSSSRRCGICPSQTIVAQSSPSVIVYEHLSPFAALTFMTCNSITELSFEAVIIFVHLYGVRKLFRPWF